MRVRLLGLPNNVISVNALCNFTESSFECENFWLWKDRSSLMTTDLQGRRIVCGAVLKVTRFSFSSAQRPPE